MVPMPVTAGMLIQGGQAPSAVDVSARTGQAANQQKAFLSQLQKTQGFR